MSTFIVVAAVTVFLRSMVVFSKFVRLSSCGCTPTSTTIRITAILIILAPVLVPLTEQIGLEPIHAGIIFVLALNISLMTPPVGACLFVLSSVTGEKLERIAVKLTPFLIAEITILFLFAFWEDAALFLPRAFGFAQ